MAEFLLNKVINEDINVLQFISWLVNEDLMVENSDIQEILSSRVSRIDFVTYFLNFIHEELPCKDKLCQTPRKLSSPKSLHLNLTTPGDIRNGWKRPNLFEPSSTNENSFNTPKSINNSLVEESSSYMSPVSPLYKPKPNFTPKDQKVQAACFKSAEKSSLCLGDFLVKTKTSSKKKKHNSHSDTEVIARRINPTNLNQNRTFTNFQKTGNSFNFKENNVDEKCPNNVDNTRSILVQERLKMLSKTEVLPPVVPKQGGTMFKSEIEPKLTDVSFKKQLAFAVEIYVNILNHNLVLNVTSEIYFLMSLLLSKQDNTDKMNRRVGNDKIREELSLGIDVLDSDKQNGFKWEESVEFTRKKHLYNSEIFESVHNIVYFAAKCLETQILLLKHLDKTTLRLLGENIRLKEMSDEFSKQLLTLALKRPERISEISNIETQTNVCFNADTDNVQNFPDQIHFHAFRKQRDLFYEILRIWETHYSLPGWQFSLSLGGKIRSLFALCQEPSNLVHLSRLFKEQLLISCVKNNNKVIGHSESQSKLPPSLANLNSEKLNLLNNRLCTKESSNGINSMPVFSGYQEFFKDFIVVASNLFFNKHLSDCLVANILELNDSRILNNDFQEQGFQVDQNTRKLFKNCIKSLRILAKFLGFIESIPYKSDSVPKSKDFMSSHVQIRSKIYPLLDIKALLHTALDKNTLILLIPWLTKYLSMLDYVTLRLPYYQEVHKLLFKIYQRKLQQKTINYNKLMIKVNLGWLFELPHFPENEYFSFCSKNREEIIDKCIVNHTTQNTLDNLDIIDQNIMYLCCPFLEEIKKLLSSNFSSNSKLSVKHITPVTAVESNHELVKRKIEQQLEEAFFNGQPLSLRKTVEFVSERVASSAVKFICHTLVPKSKESAMNELKKMLQELQINSQESGLENEQFKTLLRRKSSQLAQTQLNALIASCDHEMLEISKAKISPAIDSLLPLDTLPQTKEFCVNVSARMYADRVKYWITSHVTLTVFSKDFEQEVHKAVLGRRPEKDKVAFVLPSGGRKSSHNDSCLSGFHVLNATKDLICDMIQNCSVVSDDRVVNIFEEISNTLSERNDVNEAMICTICNTAWDLCVFLVSSRPSILTPQFMETLAKIWRHHPRLENCFKNIFSARNIKIIQKSKCLAKSWETLAKLLVFLVENEILEIADVESECTGFYQKEWPSDVLEQYAKFLEKVREYHSKNVDDDEKFLFMLDFLSDFCSDL